MTRQAVPDWRLQQERSHALVLKAMAWISLALGRRVGRVVLLGIVAYFALFAPKARRASRVYLQRVLGRPAGWWATVRHLHCFASTIHDRIYLLSDRFELFDIAVEGAESVQAALAHQPGALLVGGHLGSFEVLRALGRRTAGLKVCMMMYEDNARKINAILQAINPQAAHDIVPLGRVDSMLAVRERLDAGHLVGLLADRTLAGDALERIDFLGQAAHWPVGPWRVAALLRRPVFFMVGLYLGGKRYQVRLEQIADFSASTRETRQADIKAAMQRYVACLEQGCRQAPCNWFNFYDFWQEE
ncbi:MAG TPA: acyl-CoA synthetase [Macromonas sp.]|nr:acyl-CoA synthetase [Macromonas sp.]